MRESGKRVIAVLDGESPGYATTWSPSAADEIICNPDTMVTMLGVSAGGVFLKRALEKLHVQVQTLQYKEYKGAAEMFNRDSMSAPLRESLQAIIGDWRQVLIERIAQARKLPVEKVAELVGRGFMSARDAREAGLIDREGYAEDIRAEFDPEGKRKKFVGLARYLRHANVRERRRPSIIASRWYAESGPVISGDPSMTGDFISPETTGAQIERASRDEDVEAIVFRVNSPGGSAVGSDLVWRAVRAAQGRGKPVVVSMGDVAGSGGYYVAAGADAIVAQASTITGSIGVVYAKFDVSSLMNQFGVNIERTKSHPISDAMSPTRRDDRSRIASTRRRGRPFVRQSSPARSPRDANSMRKRPRTSRAVASGAGLRRRPADSSMMWAGWRGRSRSRARRPAFRPARRIELVSYSQSRFINTLRWSMNAGESDAISVLRREADRDAHAMDAGACASAVARRRDDARPVYRV